MPDIILVAVPFHGTVVRFHEQAIFQAGLAEHASIRFTFVVGADMTARLAGYDAVTVRPPRRLPFMPIDGFIL